MSKRPKSGKFPRLPAGKFTGKQGSASVRFEWEEDALELFQASLDAIPSEGLLVEKGDGLDDDAPPPRKVSSKGKKHRAERAQADFSLDLHGLRLAEALAAVDRFLGQLLWTGPKTVRAKIVTGKGLHSGPEGGVLVAAVYEHVRQKYREQILKIDESPAENTLAGLPLRGFFLVTLCRRT